MEGWPPPQRLTVLGNAAGHTAEAPPGDALCTPACKREDSPRGAGSQQREQPLQKPRAWKRAWGDQSLRRITKDRGPRKLAQNGTPGEEPSRIP